MNPADESEEVQLQELTSFCREKRIELEMVFVDDYEASFEPFLRRPAAYKLTEVAKVRPVNYLVVYELSRLGRTPLDTLSVLLNIVEKPRERDGLGLQVLSVREEFMNITDPSERDKLIRIINWFSEQERRRIKERQEAAWKLGKQKGRPRQIEPEELLGYIKKYPGLSMSAITKLMNEDRERAGKKRLGYSTVRMLAKRLGVRWRLMLPPQVLADGDEQSRKG
ncbi:MAG: recombinase family protein [Conexivisphaerales archaeon]